VAAAQGRLDAAGQAYAESLDIHRRLLRETGETPQAFDDLATGLERIASLAQAEPARRRAAAEEAARIRERLARLYPGSEPQQQRLQVARALLQRVLAES
jgi:hypothetical protein